MERPNPLLSSLANDAQAAESIDQFVFELGERVDALQDAEVQSRWAELGALCDAFARDAIRTGFEPMAVLSREIARAAAEAKPEAAQKGLIELTELSRRVRLGHRGSA